MSISTQLRPQTLQQTSVTKLSRTTAKQRFIWQSLTPLLIYFAIFSLLPIVWALALMFFEYSPRRDGYDALLGLGKDNPFVGLQHFKSMFQADTKEVASFRLSLKNSLLFSSLVLPLNIAMSLCLALLIEAVPQKLRVLFRTLFFLPVLSSSVAVAIMWGYLLHPQHGLANSLLSSMMGELTIIGWLADPRLSFLGIPVAMLAVVIAYLWQDLGYNLIIFTAAIQALPTQFMEAAQIDGASPWQCFKFIKLPLLYPTIALTSIFTLISAFQVFDLIEVLTDGGPFDQTRVLVLDIYKNAFRFERMGFASAESFVLFIIVFLLSLMQLKSSHCS